MQIDTAIKPNCELYGDFELIPLNLEAVQQRIDFFRDRVSEEVVVHFMERNNNDLNKYMKARDFWKEIKEKHCIKEQK